MKRARTGGFSLVEMLIVIAVLGILLAIGADRMVALRTQLKLDRAAQTLAQDLQACRNQSLAKSRVCRVAFLGNDRFEVALSNSDQGSPGAIANVCTNTNFTPLRARKLPAGVRFTNVQAGDCVAFSTRGFAHFGASTPGQFVLRDGARQRRVVPSMVGSVKVTR